MVQNSMYRLAPCRDPRFESLASGMYDPPRSLRDVLPQPDDPWSISPQLAILLYRLVTEHHLGRILEFGAGSSSVVCSAALAQIGGGRLTSIDEDPEWCAERWTMVRNQTGVDAQLIAAVPKLGFDPAGLAYTFRGAAPAVAERAPYDLVLVDAPQYYYGRDGALHLAHPHLAVGALIVLDDARRSAECWSVRRWLRTYPGLRLRLYDPYLADKGVAVLEVTKPLKPRLDAIALVSSAYHILEYWSKRRKRRRRARRR